jgi:hypothetical protein
MVDLVSQGRHRRLLPTVRCRPILNPDPQIIMSSAQTETGSPLVFEPVIDQLARQPLHVQSDYLIAVCAQMLRRTDLSQARRQHLLRVGRELADLNIACRIDNGTLSPIADDHATLAACRDGSSEGSGARPGT